MAQAVHVASNHTTHDPKRARYYMNRLSLARVASDPQQTGVFFVTPFLDSALSSTHLCESHNRWPLVCSMRFLWSRGSVERRSARHCFSLNIVGLDPSATVVK